MTEAQKKAMAEGRAKAAKERRDAKAMKPADMPVGHERDEAMRMVKDHLEERAANEFADMGGIDQTKLNRKDNEIQRHVVRRGPDRGQIPIQNPQPGYQYMRHPVVDSFSDNSARAAVRASIERAKSWGWELVTGNMPEDKDFEGNDAAGPSTARGVGDTCLWRITQENYDAMMRYDREMQDRQGQVEERLATIARNAGVNARGGDVSKDPYLQQVFGAAAAQPVTITSKFNEGDMRRGSIPGVPAPGMR